MQKQKSILKHFLVCLAFMFLVVGCQKEYVDIKKPDNTIAISADDTVAGLILKVVLKDGSFDNIIDKCSEISIDFPYSIRVDDKLFTINSIEDIKLIKTDYFQEYDDIEVIYPVSVTFSNYTKAILYDDDDLEQIQEQYNNGLEDDDIECIDFVYPLGLTLYNTEYQKTDFVTVNNDQDMYNVFANINSLIIEFDFPVSVKTANGDSISIDDNVALEYEINKVAGNCDEDDEVIFDDTDYPYIELLISKAWKIALFADTADVTSYFSNYSLIFNTDHSVKAKTDVDTFSGVWELDFTDTSSVLEIEFDTDMTPLIWLNNGWVFKNTGSDLIEMEAESDFDGYIKKLSLIPE